MPNHFHAVLFLEDIPVGAYCNTPLPKHASERPAFRSPSQSLGAIVRGFKGAATKQINQTRLTPGEHVWQRNYYEHIIRGEDDLNRARAYIALNPLRWAVDRENPDRRRRKNETPAGSLSNNA